MSEVKKKVSNIIVLVLAFPLIALVLINSFAWIDVLVATDVSTDTQALLAEEPDADFSTEDDELPLRLLSGETGELIVNSQDGISFREDKLFDLLEQDPDDYGRITANTTPRMLLYTDYPEYAGQTAYHFRFVFYAKDQEICPAKDLEFVCLKAEGEVLILERKKTIYKDVRLLSERPDVDIFSYEVSPQAFWTRYVNDNGEVRRVRSGIGHISGWEAWARMM